MRGRRGRRHCTASPVLVGAVTVLVTIVAVFLSYNANSGLPFVPTYDLKANLPNAAQLVKGFEVRIGGARVGLGLEDRAASGATTAPTYAQVDDEARQGDRAAAGRTRRCSCARARRSASSTSSSTPGPRRGRTSRPARRSRSARRARRRSSSTSSSTCSTRKARVGSAQLARRLRRRARRPRPGPQHGDRGVRPAADRPRAGGGEPGSAPDAARPLLQGRSATPPREVAPVAEEQASLFVNLDITFTALAGDRAALPPGDDLRGPADARRSRSASSRCQRPFLRNNAALFRELRPGVATLPHSAPILADAFEAGTGCCRRRRRSNRDLADVFDALADFSEDPLVRGGRRAAHAAVLARCKPTLALPRRRPRPPATTRRSCSATPSSLLSDGDPNGTWQRFIIIAAPRSARSNAFGPNNEGSAVGRRPPTGPSVENHLHANPYPNTAAPGQTQRVRGGQRALRARPDGDRQRARQPGHEDERPGRRLGHGDGRHEDQARIQPVHARSRRA